MTAMHSGRASSVAIVGAGLVGTLLAMVMARRNFRVEVYERLSDPRTLDWSTGRSINLTLCTRGFAALDRVGVGDALRSLGKLAIDLASIADFQGEFSFHMRIVKMRDGFGHPQKTMDVVGGRKHRAGHFPGAGALGRDRLNDLCLAFANRAQIAVKEFFVVVHGVAMATQDQGWRQRAHPGQADQIFCERTKASGSIDRVRGENWIWRNALQDAVAGNHRAIGLPHKRARARRVTGSVHHLQSS